MSEIEIPEERWILTYLDEIAKGHINAPKRVIKQYEQLVPILEHKDPRWGYSQKAAYHPIFFAETFCNQSTDVWRGKGMKLLLWQKAALSAIYGIRDKETGLRKFQKVFILVGKKNGKTTMMAPVALMETLEPGNTIVSAGNVLKQSKIIWDEAAHMLSQSPWLEKKLKKRVFDITNKDTDSGNFSKFMPVANKPQYLDGLLPKIVILDEVHELDQGLYNILHNGQISVQDPLLFMLTTKGNKRAGLFDAEYENSKNIIDGLIVDERKFSLLYELDDPSDWKNPDVWEQANPSLGVILTKEKFKEIIQDAENKPTELNDIKTKHFNISAKSGEAYFSLDEIENDEKFTAETFAGKDVIGGFDLSRTDDMTAFATTYYDHDTDKFYTEVMYWITEDYYNAMLEDSRMAETWRVWISQGHVRIAGQHLIDTSVITRYVLEMVEKYGVYYRWIYYDAYSASYLVNELNDAGFREDLCLIRAQQGYKTLSIPMQVLCTDVKAKKVVYNNNPVLKWNMTNVDVEYDVNANMRPVKAEGKNKRKIDGFAALLNTFVGFTEHSQDLGVNMK